MRTFVLLWSVLSAALVAACGLPFSSVPFVDAITTAAPPPVATRSASAETGTNTPHPSWEAIAQPGIVTAAGGSSIGRFYQRAYALVIGMNGYRNQGWPALHSAVPDAKAVADALRLHGFEVSYHEDLDSAAMKRVLDEFFIVKGNDPSAGLFFWYAGHGATLDGEGYLVPVDAPAITTDATFRLGAVAMREFGRLMREARSGHVLAVFDSCFSGSIFKNARSGSMPPVIERAFSLPVRQYISAGDEHQFVLDDGGFRTAFVDAITGRNPAADMDANGYVTGQELGMFMHQTLTTRSNGKQVPKYGALADGDYDGGDFIFRVSNGSAVAAAAVAAPSLPRSSDTMAFMRTTKVFVASPLGAAREANAEIHKALSDELRQQGLNVIPQDSDYAFKVHTIVTKRQIGLLMDEVVVRWEVFDRTRVRLGVVERRREVMSGGLSGSWGGEARDTARYAVERITHLLSRPL